MKNILKMKTAALILCILVCFLMPACSTKQMVSVEHALPLEQALSLKFVSCDTDGNLHVKFVNNTDRRLYIDNTLGGGDHFSDDLSVYLHVISIEQPGWRTMDSLPYLWKKLNPPVAGSYIVSNIKIAPHESRDCKVNIYGAEWLHPNFENASSKITDGTKKLSAGDELVIIFLGSWWQRYQDQGYQDLNQDKWGTLICHGKVSREKAKTVE